MTKYVLNSGGIASHKDKGKKFFQECFNGLGPNPKVLVCLFAIPREFWEARMKDFENVYIYPEGIRPIFELAFPENLEQQIKNSDLIYMSGGDDHLLQYWLKKFNIPEIWKGKVVATNSASSDALSKYFWAGDWRQNMEGLGILPIKFFGHYKSAYGNDNPSGPIDWEKAYEELKNYGDKDLPIYALEEGEFVVFSKD
jgi:hypothetical protein